VQQQEKHARQQGRPLFRHRQLLARLQELSLRTKEAHLPRWRMLHLQQHRGRVHHQTTLPRLGMESVMLLRVVQILLVSVVALVVVPVVGIVVALAVDTVVALEEEETVVALEEVDTVVALEEVDTVEEVLVVVVVALVTRPHWEQAEELAPATLTGVEVGVVDAGVQGEAEVVAHPLTQACREQPSRPKWQRRLWRSRQPWRIRSSSRRLRRVRSDSWFTSSSFTNNSKPGVSLVGPITSARCTGIS